VKTPSELDGKAPVHSPGGASERPGAETRREAFLRLGRGALRLGFAGAVVSSVAELLRRPPAARSREDAETGILRPPGALEEADFLATCIRCELCADACPRRCIRMLGPAEGRASGTPYIVASERACDACLECTLACPSGALRATQDPRTVRMGVAVVDERLCVSHNGTGVCGACHTACPFRDDVITQGVHEAPTVIAENCIGCGLCEEACIVDDRKAIRVFSERSWA